MRKYGSSSVSRALRLLITIVDDCGRSGLSAIARQQALPPSTAYRLTAAMVREGMILPVGRGRYLPGPGLVQRKNLLSLHPSLVALSRPLLAKLALDTGRTAHLGILENDMVTYLVKSGQKADEIFTKEGKQLEAYCSSVGKILLAALPPHTLREYLSDGPFVPLTANTMTDPVQLLKEIEKVRVLGIARDNEEVALGLHCIAVAVNDPSGVPMAALSISGTALNVCGSDFDSLVAALRNAARKIEQAVFARRK